jgi:hypothetical protein
MGLSYSVATQKNSQRSGGMKDGFGHIDGYIGDSLMDVISRWEKLFS